MTDDYHISTVPTLEDVKKKEAIDFMNFLKYSDEYFINPFGVIMDSNGKTYSVAELYNIWKPKS